ncbi:transmembrane protein 132D-like [Sinocyclocheilus anshuiensis]|uniref:transmembrane protein 132D-like n=1 Tax=Sinocyclocheilus anshuiensis TaxID=1608454 RepID=UPI0007B7FEB4|nr:PREDICTED: transmembrane protein 132D-like [Sinocyclocheilus anshuiensis]
MGHGWTDDWCFALPRHFLRGRDHDRTHEVKDSYQQEKTESTPVAKMSVYSHLWRILQIFLATIITAVTQELDNQEISDATKSSIPYPLFLPVTYQVWDADYFLLKEAGQDIMGNSSMQSHTQPFVVLRAGRLPVINANYGPLSNKQEIPLDLVQAMVKKGVCFCTATPSNTLLWDITLDTGPDGSVGVICQRKSSTNVKRLNKLQAILQMNFEVEDVSSQSEIQVIKWELMLPDEVKMMGASEGTMRIYTTQRDFVGLAPLVMDTELLNTAVLTGKRVMVGVRTIGVEQDGSVTDVSEFADCSSTDEDVLKVSDRCDFVYVNGKETQGRLWMLVNFTYSYLSAQLEMKVWFPRLPLVIEVSDTELSQIKSWRIPILSTKSKPGWSSEDCLQLSTGSNRVISATATTQEVLINPKQEAVLSSWLQFSDGSLTPLDIYDPTHYRLAVTSLDEGVISVQDSPMTIVAEGEGQGTLVRAEMTICEVCQKSKRKSTLAVGTGSLTVKFQTNSKRPENSSINNNDTGTSKGPLSNRPLTDLEIGMYALLGVFCLAIIVFMVNCVSYLVKFRHKQTPGQVSEQTGHRHDWVWLGTDAELVMNVTGSPLEQDAHNTSVIDIGPNMEPCGTLTQRTSCQVSSVLNYSNVSCVGSPKAKPVRSESLHSPTSKRKRVQFTTFTSLDRQTPPKTLPQENGHGINWVGKTHGHHYLGSHGRGLHNRLEYAIQSEKL